MQESSDDRGALVRKPRLKEVETLSPGLGEPDLPLRSRGDEHLVVAGHPSSAVPVGLTDLQEGSPRHFPTPAVQVLEDGEHHSGPAVTGVEIRTEGEPQTPRLLARGLQQPLDTLQPTLCLQTSHLSPQGAEDSATLGPMTGSVKTAVCPQRTGQERLPSTVG